MEEISKNEDSLRDPLYRSTERKSAEYTIREATPTHLSGIAAIYNDAIRNSIATFQIREKSVAEQEAWFESLISERYPIFVAESPEGEVLAWSALNPWNDRCAYSNTVEISTYVHSDFRGQGIGTQLKRHTIEAGQERGYHTVISRIAGSNPVNEALNRELGFRYIGTMKEVGFKFSEFHDVHLYQKIYTDS